MSIGKQDMPGPNWPPEPPQNLERKTATSETPSSPHWQRDMPPRYIARRP